MNEDAVAVIFANGELTDTENIRKLLDCADLIAAADGGLKHVLRMGYTPHLLIGDMDSVELNDLAQMKAKGIDVKVHPADKDETDLELVLEGVLQRGYQRIRVLAALGGRLDQTLGNLFLLTQPQLAGCDVRFIDEKLEAFVIRGDGHVDGKPGDTLSLIPMGIPARGIYTEGLKYRLEGETLFAEHTRGISNLMTGNRAEIHIQEGILLCIHMFSQ